jgi:hypothetical protein
MRAVRGPSCGRDLGSSHQFPADRTAQSLQLPSPATPWLTALPGADGLRRPAADPPLIAGGREIAAVRDVRNGDGKAMRRLCLRERRSARVVPGHGSTPAAPVGVELPDPLGHRPDSRQAVTQVSMQQRPVKGPGLRRHPGGVLQEEARHSHGMERPPRRLPGMIQREKLLEKLVARPRRDNPAALSAPRHARCSHSRSTSGQPLPPPDETDSIKPADTRCGTNQPKDSRTLSETNPSPIKWS